MIRRRDYTEEYYTLHGEETIWRETIIYGRRNYIEDGVGLHEEGLHYIMGELHGKETK